MPASEEHRRVVRRKAERLGRAERERDAAMVDAYQAGASLRDLADDSGLSPEKARKILQAAGASLRAPHTHHGARGPQ